MAAPHVAGAIALLHSFRPDLSVSQAKSVLLQTADKISSVHSLVQSGRLNMLAMLGGEPLAPGPKGYSVEVEHKGQKLRPRARVWLQASSENNLNSYQLHFHGTDVVCDLGLGTNEVNFRLTGSLAFLSHVPAISISAVDPVSEEADQATVLLAQRAIRASLKERKRSASVRLLRKRALRRIEALGAKACSKVQRSVRVG